MAKLSKQASRTFEYNMKKARGLVRLQFYAEDLLRTGGRESLGKFMQFLADMMASFGLEDILDLPRLIEGEISPIIQEKLGPMLEERFANLDEEKLQKAAEEFERKLAPRIPELKALTEELVLAIERVLLEQALVTAVTALEVYLYDVTIEAVAKNMYIQRRFTGRLQERFSYKALLEARGDLGLALGRVVADSYSFYKPDSLAKHLSILMGDSAPMKDYVDKAEFMRILALRNLVVHRAGIVDKEFKERTGYKGRTGSPVSIARAAVEGAMAFAVRLAKQVQEGLEHLRAPSGREPPRSEML